MTGGVLRPADDAALLAWFTPDALPLNIAFPDHERQVLAVWQQAVAREPHPKAAPHMVVFVAPTLGRENTFGTEARR